MTDDELPPLPHYLKQLAGDIAYLPDCHIRDYARLAIEQDRARPVPGEEELWNLINAYAQFRTAWQGLAADQSKDALRAAIRQALRSGPVASAEITQEDLDAMRKLADWHEHQITFLPESTVLKLHSEAAALLRKAYL